MAVSVHPSPLLLLLRRLKTVSADYSPPTLDERAQKIAKIQRPCLCLLSLRSGLRQQKKDRQRQKGGVVNSSLSNLMPMLLALVVQHAPYRLSLFQATWVPTLFPYRHSFLDLISFAPVDSPGGWKRH